MYESFEDVQDQLDYLKSRGLFEDLDNQKYIIFTKGIETLFNEKLLTENQRILIDQDDEYLTIRGESLKDTMLRMKKWMRLEYLLWKNKESILIVTHGNWLRGVIKMLDKLTNNQVLSYNIPTASPILYDLINLEVQNKIYLEDEETIKKRALMVFEQTK